MLQTLCRFYHVSSVTYNSKKQGIKLCKMLNPKNKRQWYRSDMDTMPTVKSLAQVKHEPGKSGVRRLAMLNKLFMKNITDIMSTGTMSMNIVGRGIEVSKVKVTPDFNTVKVYWISKGDSTDTETDKLLNKISGALRHELSTLRVMGQVPYIIFVKDRQETQVVDLDRRLQIADYGNDYVPTEMGDILKTEFTLDTKLSPEMKAKIKQLEDDLPITEDPIPEMTHTVFGLDHEKLMNRLLAARKRSKDAWSNIDVDPVISYRSPGVSTPEVDVGMQKQELADFLLKRQLDWEAFGKLRQVFTAFIPQCLKTKIQQEKLSRQLRRTDNLQLAYEENEDDDTYDDEDDEEDDDYYGENYNYYQEKQYAPNNVARIDK